MSTTIPTRRVPRARRFWFLATLALILTLCIGPGVLAAPGSSGPGLPIARAESGLTHKVIAPHGVLQEELPGVSLWHDYGSFALFRVSIGNTWASAAGSYSIDVTGIATAGTKSQTVDLNLFAAVPAGPGLLTPADGAVDVPFKPTFSWTAVAQATSYLLEVATDAGFASIVYSVSETGTSHTAAVPLSANTTYYWRVTAIGAGISGTFSFTTQAATMICNGSAVDFEDGIPADWTVVDNSPGGIVWTTTADPACEIGNLTNGTGEAACADSDAAGYGVPPYDTELVSNPLDFSAVGAAVLDVKAYYRDITTGSNDRFEVDVWDGVSWTNELSWDEDHRPEDFSLNLSAYAGKPVVQVRFRYSGDGYDWYAQVDDIALTCVGVSPPVIEVDPASLTAWQWPDVVSTQPMTITNSGGLPLNWTIDEDDTACDSPIDIPWLSVSPNAGTTFPLDSTVVDVSFDSLGLAPGDYTANLCVNSDDPATGVVQVPVALTVPPPELLLCNGAMIEFEDGIPSGWAVIDNTGGTGIVWTTTADPACEIPNRTNGSGEAACADSDAAGTPATPYDTELWTPPIDLSGQGAVVLDVKAYYRDITTGSNDRFEVDVWDGVGWTNELSWDEGHMPEDFSLNLSAYAGLLDARVRFRYSGDGYDWYAQVDDIALTCVGVSPPVIEVDPASLTAWQWPDVVSTQPMTITNSGGLPLNWTIDEDDTACDSPIDIPWLSVSPNAGTTIPLDSTVVDVSFDSSGMAPGDYSANLCVNSDDPATSLVQVPVYLTVEPPEYLECNGAMIEFEDGIPSGWGVVDNTGGTGIVWTTTADPACEIPNQTNGSGEAACADSEAAGEPAIPYDTELWTPFIDLSGQGAVVLDVKAYYSDYNTGSNDRFEVDVWDGVGWTNELSWDENHTPEDFSLNLSAYAGLAGVRVRFRYYGNGYDYYAQVDDIELTCTSVTRPIIGVDPASLAASQGPDAQSTQPLNISNSGDSALNWTIDEDDKGCDSPADIPWLSVSPDMGTTAPGSSTPVDVTTDSTGLGAGLYHANLCVRSDDPVTPLVVVPVDMTVSNEPPVGAADPGSQSPQYSDEISPIIVEVMDSIGDVLTAVPSWSSDGVTFKPGLPDFLALSAPSCVDSGGGMQTCTWIISGAIDLPEGVYTVRTTVSDNYGGVTVLDALIEVITEDAAVAFDDANPMLVQVAEPGGASGPFSLTMYVTEKEPDLPADGVSGVAPGDISRADVDVEVVPVGPGPGPAFSCATSFAPIGYAGEITIVCDLADVEVNVYTVEVTVNDGGYYTGSGEDVLVVYDPSLGFTTGGGWFYWPGTTDRTNFGYTMKYNKKGTNVKGSLLLIRHTAEGNYRVKSNALYGLALGDMGTFTWASFSGKATYLEPGWPEAIGNYQFLVYVEDHGEPGAGVDRFWVEVQDKDRNPATLSLPREAIDNAQVLEGGNLIVPH